MRILHTADWHLGAKLGAHDRASDQARALEEVTELAERFRPDWIVHAGDVFDSFQPGHRTLRMAVDALNRLARTAPVTVIGGNHDSYPLLRALDRFRRRPEERIRFVTEPAVLEPVEGLRVTAMPFQTPAQTAEWLQEDPETERERYADRIRCIETRLAAGAAGDGTRREVEVYAAHLYVAGSRPSRSERRATLSDDYACRSVEGAFDYGAYGHIHDAQAVGAGEPPAWYAGALVALDFGERESTKSTTLVTVANGRTDIVQEPHGSGRRLVTFRGTLAGLRHEAAEGKLNDAIVRATVESDERVYELAEAVTEGSPDTAIHELVNHVANALPGPQADHEYEESEEPSLGTLYAEWRKARGGESRECDAPAVALFEEALANAETPGTSDFGLGELSRTADEILERLRQAAGGGEAGE